MAEEFEEIAHSGGKVTFNVVTKDGRRTYQVGYSTSSPKPFIMYGLWALPFGMAVGPLDMGGLGAPSNPPPFPGCIPVLIACDSEGKFGHHCPRCNEYWRSGPHVSVCPYCALHADTHDFLSIAQQRYVRHYCDVLTTALDDVTDGETLIDMDEIVHTASQGEERPAFYVSEQNQQYKFSCVACNEENDILGRFGYCATCGTRNDWDQFTKETILDIRKCLNAGQKPEGQVRDAISAFDTFAAQYAKQLADLVPLTLRRRNKLTSSPFHNLEELAKSLKDYFDIDIFKGISVKDQQFTSLMFHRRHVYEHKGGEVDQKYIEESGDSSVRPKQRISETKDSVHSLLGFLSKMSKNLHEGFHELFPPISEPIKAYEEKKERIEQYKTADN